MNCFASGRKPGVGLLALAAQRAAMRAFLSTFAGSDILKELLNHASEGARDFDIRGLRARCFRAELPFLSARTRQDPTLECWGI